MSDTRRKFPRERRLRKRSEFSAVYEGGRSWASRWLALKARPNGLPESRCGFSVSKKVGKAVARNRVRRRLREIVRLSRIVAGWDIIYVARVPAAEADYDALKKAVEDLMKRSGLLANERQHSADGQSQP